MRNERVVKMIRYQGKGVYGAIAVGKVLKWKHEDIQIKCEKIEDTAQEVEMNLLKLWVLYRMYRIFRKWIGRH